MSVTNGPYCSNPVSAGRQLGYHVFHEMPFLLKPNICWATVGYEHREMSLLAKPDICWETGKRNCERDVSPYCPNLASAWRE